MEKFGLFNSSAGDRTYNAVDFAAYFGDLVSNGVFYRNSDNLKVTPGAGFTVETAPGSAWINGYRYENTAALSLQLETAHGVQAHATSAEVTRRFRFASSRRASRVN